MIPGVYPGPFGFGGDAATPGAELGPANGPYGPWLWSRCEHGSGFELVDLWRLLPQSEHYSYIFEGNGQVLDHILVTPILLLAKPEYQAVHMNSEFDAEQQSDHDPPLLRLTIR